MAGTVTMALALLLATASTAAQEKPDFSGSWVLETVTPVNADVPRALVVRQSRQTTDARGAPMPPYFKTIAIEKESESGKTAETYEIGLIAGTLSGTVGQGGDPATRTLSQVKWMGADLIIDTGSYAVDAAGSRQWFEREQVWALDGTGRLIVSITTRTATAGPITISGVYRRR